MKRGRFISLAGVHNHHRDTENTEIVFFVCRETAANEKHSVKDGPWAEQRPVLFPVKAGCFCPSLYLSRHSFSGGTSPDGQKRKILCALCASVVIKYYSKDVIVFTRQRTKLLEIDNI